MKKLFVLIFMVSCLQTPGEKSDKTSYSNENKEYTIQINGEVPDGDYLYLSRRASGDWLNLDSVLVVSGQNPSFTGSLDAPEILYLRTDESSKPVSFFGENSQIKIRPDFDNPDSSEINGSATHDEYMAYNDRFTKINLAKDELMKQYRSAQEESNNIRVAEIVAGFDSLSNLETEITKNYLTENTSSWVSPYVMRRTLYYSMDAQELKAALETLDKHLAESVYYQELKNHISVREKVSTGKVFSDFKLPTPEGTMLSLSEIAGDKYILIDFWASWCGPCRRENPNVVALYQKFRDKGFEILGVSFDTNRENWLKAIEDDKLTWYHVSDLQGWKNAAGKIYGVNSIPHTVLIGPDNTIVAKNLRSEELEEMLSKLLDSQ